MIRRGKDPENHFQILPNSTIRDRRLSFRARGLLAFMLSYPENWEFNRDWIARESEKDGVSAVRTTLKELEDAGYLVRRKVRVNGRFKWEQFVYRHAQPKAPGESTGGSSADGISAAGDQPCKEDGHEDSQEDSETDTCPPLASSRRRDEFEDQDDGDQVSWRQQDLELFRSLLSDHITSDGSGKWNKGTWKAETFYRSFRKVRNKKWPGRWLQEISERDIGLEYWLLDEGLEIS